MSYQDQQGKGQGAAQRKRSEKMISEMALPVVVNDADPTGKAWRHAAVRPWGALGKQGRPSTAIDGRSDRLRFAGRQAPRPTGVQGAAWCLLSCLLWLGVTHCPPVGASTIHKCSTDQGEWVYSDRPCASDSATDSHADQLIEQKDLRTVSSADGAGLPTAADITQRCESPSGRELPMAEVLADSRSAALDALKGLLTSMALSAYSRERISTLKIYQDDHGTIALCPASPASRFPIYLIERNGRVIELRPSGQVKSRNDAHDPMVLASRCSDLLAACMDPTRSGHSIDACFESVPTCPQGTLDPGIRCCPGACKDAYRLERRKGTDPMTASSAVLFGNLVRGQSCTADAAAR